MTSEKCNLRHVQLHLDNCDGNVLFRDYKYGGNRDVR